MRKLLSILLLLTAGCTVRHVPVYDEKLSPSGQRLLESNGLSTKINSPWSVMNNWLSDDLSIYRKENAKITVDYQDDCRDVAVSIIAILSVGLLPCPCPISVKVSYSDEKLGTLNNYEKFWDEYFGWLVPPLTLLPRWKFSANDETRGVEMKNLSNQAIITSVNKIAASIEK